MVELNYPNGATPLSRDEIQGLLLTHITTRAQLDRWEQDNINEALAWIEQHTPTDILSESFMKLLHKKMFSNVWAWAGEFRQREKSLGVAWYSISTDLKKTKFFQKNKGGLFAVKKSNITVWRKG